MGALGEFWNEAAATRLRNALEEKGLSVEELAELVGVSPRAVRMWLKTDGPPTRPSVRTLPKICTAVGVPLDEFRALGEAYAKRAPAPAAPLPAPAEIPREPKRRLAPFIIAIVVAAVAVVIAIAALWSARNGYRQRPGITSYSIPSSDDNYEEAWAGRVSPDGRYIAFMAVVRDGSGTARQDLPPRQLFYLSTERDARAVPIPGTEGVFTTFFWDDASKGLYFIRSKKLMYVAIGGGPADSIADVEGGTHGDANSSGEVVLGSRHGLFFISSDRKVQLRQSSSWQLFPTFLPDGKRFLYIEQHQDAGGNAQRDLYSMSWSDRTPKLIERNIPSRVEYSRGHLLYVRDCALLARRFDLETETLGAEEYKIKDNVWMEDVSGSASFSTSNNGVLVTQAPPVVSPVEEVRATARGLERKPLPAMNDVKSIAIRGNKVVLARIDRCKQTHVLWRASLNGDSQECLTCGRSSSTSPVISPDGSRLYFAATRGNTMGIYSIALGDPDEQLLFESPHFPAPRDVTADGKQLIIQTTVNRDGSLWTIPAVRSTSAIATVATPEMEGESGRLSPDGQWLAFSAVRESGGGVFVVRAGAPSSEARLIGPKGWRCRWSRDGTKLYYAEENAVKEYDFAGNSTRTLFEQNANVTEFAVVGNDTFYVVTTSEAHNRVDGDWTRELPDP